MKHERATHPTEKDCGPYGCNVCNLFICSVCGGVEGSLTTDCPCYQVPYIMGQLVYAGAIDFVVDQWITKDKTIEIDIRERKKNDRP
jgi:hypothetical protein